MESLRIAMIGAGAIGGITAAHMKQAGYDVHLVCKHDEIARLTRERGLHITGVHGEKQVQIPAVATIEELQGTFDLCLIATKAYDMPEAAAQMQAKAARGRMGGIDAKRHLHGRAGRRWSAGNGRWAV